MRRVLWSIVWGALSIGAVTTVLAGRTTLFMTLSETDIQPRIDWFLPQEHNGIRLDRARISLFGSTLRIDAGLSGAQLAQSASAELLAMGTLSYDPQRAEYFFRPTSIDLSKLALPENPAISRLGEAAARLRTKTLPGQASMEETARILIERVANFAIRRAPIYKLEDDANYLILHPILYSIELRGSKFVAEFKLWRPTVGVVLALLVIGCALSLMIVLLLHPNRGIPQPDIRTKPASLPEFLKRSGRH